MQITEFKATSFSKIYVTSIELGNRLTGTDLEFLDTFSRAHKLLQNIESQQGSDRIRMTSLEKIKLLCRNFSYGEIMISYSRRSWKISKCVTLVVIVT